MSPRPLYRSCSLSVSAPKGGDVEPAAAQRLWQLARETRCCSGDCARGPGLRGLAGPPWWLVAPVPVEAAVLVELVSARVGALGEAEADVLDYVALAEP